MTAFKCWTLLFLRSKSHIKVIKEGFLQKDKYKIIVQAFSTPGAVDESHVLKSTVDQLLATSCGGLIKKFAKSNLSWLLKIAGSQQGVHVVWIFVLMTMDDGQYLTHSSGVARLHLLDKYSLECR